MPKPVRRYTGSRKVMPRSDTHNLFPYQAQLMESDRKILALLGATATGKTWLAPRWLYSQILENPGCEWIVSGPTIPQMKRTINKYILRYLNEEGIPYDYNKVDMEFHIGDGLATVYCISAETPDRMHGIHAKGILGDEAGMYDKLWYDVALQRLSFTKGRMLLITTPYSLNWLYNEIYLPWGKGDPKIELVSPAFLDNPLADLDEYLDAAKRLPRWKFLMMYHAQFTRPQGLIYPRYSICDRFEIPNSWTRARALDFGWNNPTGILWLAQSPKSKRWYAYQEKKESGMDMDHLEKALKSDNRGTVYCDPSAKQLIESLRRHGLPMKAGLNEVLSGIATTHAGLRNENLVVFSDLCHLRDELNSYQYEMEVKTGELRDRPIKYNDHLVDALRYFYATLYSKGTPTASYIDDRVLTTVRPETVEQIDNMFGDD